MENVQLTVIDGKLPIVVDHKQEQGLTKSEKSISVAKTGGWGQKIRIDGQEYTISVNVYKPLPAGEVPSGTIELS